MVEGTLKGGTAYGHMKHILLLASEKGASKWLTSLPQDRGGSYFAEVGNLPIFMAENGNIA